MSDLCKDFCTRYISCLKGKLQSEQLLRVDSSGLEGDEFGPVPGTPTMTSAMSTGAVQPGSFAQVGAGQVSRRVSFLILTLFVVLFLERIVGNFREIMDNLWELLRIMGNLWELLRIWGYFPEIVGNLGILQRIVDNFPVIIGNLGQL